MLAAADAAAAATLAAARDEAVQLRALAREKGAADGAAVLANERSRAERTARGVVMAARRAADDRLRQAARDAVSDLRSDPSYPRILAGLRARAMRERGAVGRDQRASARGDRRRGRRQTSGVLAGRAGRRRDGSPRGGRRVAVVTVTADTSPVRDASSASTARSWRSTASAGSRCPRWSSSGPHASRARSSPSRAECRRRRHTSTPAGSRRDMPCALWASRCPRPWVRRCSAACSTACCVRCSGPARG